MNDLQRSCDIWGFWLSNSLPWQLAKCIRVAQRRWSGWVVCATSFPHTCISL